MAQVVHNAFATTGIHGLRHDILPMRLYHKAKRLGIWDPRSIDFSQDIIDWQRCTEEERQALILQTALFQAGEESVTLDLLPLIMAVAQDGHHDRRGRTGRDRLLWLLQYARAQQHYAWTPAGH